MHSICLLNHTHTTSFMLGSLGNIIYVVRQPVVQDTPTTQYNVYVLYMSIHKILCTNNNMKPNYCLGKELATGKMVTQDTNYM